MSRRFLREWRYPEHEAEKPFRIAIKVRVRNHAQRNYGGDWVFAEALGRAFLRLGHPVRLDSLADFQDDRGAATLELVLFAPMPYEWSRKIPGVAWAIFPSDNRRLLPDIFRGAAHIFMASSVLANTEAFQRVAPTSFLPQACDRYVMQPGTGPRDGIVFIANNHFGDEMRPIAKLAMQSGIPFKLWGDGWTDLPPQVTFMGKYIPFDAIGPVYQQAKIVLSDHLDRMRVLGFLNNRMFDVWASGAALICDPVKWLPLGTELRTARCETVSDFQAAVAHFLSDAPGHEPASIGVSAMVRDNHSFDARAAEILERVRAL